MHWLSYATTVIGTVGGIGFLLAMAAFTVATCGSGSSCAAPTIVAHLVIFLFASVALAAPWMPVRYSPASSTVKRWLPSLGICLFATARMIVRAFQDEQSIRAEAELTLQPTTIFAICVAAFAAGNGAGLSTAPLPKAQQVAARSTVSVVIAAVAVQIAVLSGRYAVLAVFACILLCHYMGCTSAARVDEAGRFLVSCVQQLHRKVDRSDQAHASALRMARSLREEFRGWAG